MPEGAGGGAVSRLEMVEGHDDRGLVARGGEGFAVAGDAGLAEGEGEAGAGDGERGDGGKAPAFPTAPRLVHRGDGTAREERREVVGKLAGRGMALGGVAGAEAEEDGVEVREVPGVGPACGVGREAGELLGGLVGCELEEDKAEAVEVGGGGAGSLGGDVALGADAAEGGLGGGDEAKVRELGDAPDEDDVGGLDVAVKETLAMEHGKGARNVDSHVGGLGHGDAAPPPAQFPEGEGDIGLGAEGGRAGGVVGQLHDVSEGALGVVGLDVEDGELGGLAEGGGLEPSDPRELAPEEVPVVVGRGADKLDRAPDAGLGTGEPDGAEASAADLADEGVAGRGAGPAHGSPWSSSSRSSTRRFLRAFSTRWHAT